MFIIARFSTSQTSSLTGWIIFSLYFLIISNYISIYTNPRTVKKISCIKCVRVSIVCTQFSFMYCSPLYIHGDVHYFQFYCCYFIKNNVYKGCRTVKFFHLVLCNPVCKMEINFPTRVSNLILKFSFNVTLEISYKPA